MADRDWSNTGLAGGTDAGLIDDKVRDFREDTQQRQVQGAHKMESLAGGPATGVNETEDGKHCVGVETQSFYTDAGLITLAWNFAGTTERIRHYGGSHASKADLTEFIGDIAPLSPSTTIAFRGMSWASAGWVSIGDTVPAAGVYLKRIVYRAGDPASFTAPNRTIKQVRITVGTKPVGADLVVNLRKRVAPQTDSQDPFVDGASTAFTDSVITLTAASGDYILTHTLSTPEVLAPGDEVVVKYGSVGTVVAKDVTIALLVE